MLRLGRYPACRPACGCLRIGFLVSYQTLARTRVVAKILISSRRGRIGANSVETERTERILKRATAPHG